MYVKLYEINISWSTYQRYLEFLLEEKKQNYQ